MGVENMYAGIRARRCLALAVGALLLMGVMSPAANAGVVDGKEYVSIDARTGDRTVFVVPDELPYDTKALSSPSNLPRDTGYGDGTENPPKGYPYGPFGKSPLKPAGNPDYYPIAQIAMVKDGKKTAMCSAAFVSKNVLLTSAHCLYSDGAQTGINVVMPGMNGEDVDDPTAAGEKLEPTTFIVPMDWTRTQQDGDDYGVIVVDGAYSSWYDYKVMGTYCWGGCNQEVTITGYPGTLNRENPLDKHSRYLGSRMWTEHGNVKEPCYNRFTGTYQCDSDPLTQTTLWSYPGISGAAMVEGIASPTEDRYIVGVNKGMYQVNKPDKQISVRMGDSMFSMVRRTVLDND